MTIGNQISDSPTDASENHIVVTRPLPTPSPPTRLAGNLNFYLGYEELCLAHWSGDYCFLPLLHFRKQGVLKFSEATDNSTPSDLYKVPEAASTYYNDDEMQTDHDETTDKEIIRFFSLVFL